MQASLIVFLGAGCGGVLRHLINTWVARLLPMQTVVSAGFPLATFLINITGSLVMGLIVGWLTFKAGGLSGDGASQAWSQPVRLFLTTGILGGYTTFSAFSLDTMLLFERGAYSMAVFYILGSVILSLFACALGLFVMRTIL